MTDRQCYRFIHVAIVVIATALSIPKDASAASCGPYHSLAKELEQRHGETLAGLGLSSGRSMIRVFVNPMTDAWSILIVQPNGQACLFSAGQGWRRFPLRKPEGPPV